MTGLIANGWFWAGAFTAVLAAGVWLTARFGGTGKGRHKGSEQPFRREPETEVTDTLDFFAELRAARLRPFPGDEPEFLPAPVAEPAPVPAAALEPLPPAPEPAPAVPPPAAVQARAADADRLGALIGVPHLDTAALVEEMAARAYGHHGSARLTELSNWRKADGLALAEAVRNG